MRPSSMDNAQLGIGLSVNEDHTVATEAIAAIRFAKSDELK